MNTLAPKVLSALIASTVISTTMAEDPTTHIQAVSVNVMGTDVNGEPFTFSVPVETWTAVYANFLKSWPFITPAKSAAHTHNVKTRKEGRAIANGDQATKLDELRNQQKALRDQSKALREEMKTKKAELTAKATALKNGGAIPNSPESEPVEQLASNPPPMTDSPDTIEGAVMAQSPTESHPKKGRNK